MLPCVAAQANACAINATGRATVTQYRMTQFGVVDMDNKNTGDMGGDTSFVISRRTTAYECRKNPNNFMCSGLAQFDGDDPNSTDLVLEWKLTVDGNWGPYLECNPLDAKHPLQGWECSNGLMGMGLHDMPEPPPNYPAVCSAHYKGADGYELQGYGSSTLSTPDLAACCAAASKPGSYGPAQSFTYFQANKTCQLYRFAFRGSLSAGAISGVMPPPPPPPPGTPGAICACDRVNHTVGREPLSSMMGGGHSSVSLLLFRIVVDSKVPQRASSATLACGRCLLTLADHLLSNNFLPTGTVRLHFRSLVLNFVSSYAADECGWRDLVLLSCCWRMRQWCDGGGRQWLHVASSRHRESDQREVCPRPCIWFRQASAPKTPNQRQRLITRALLGLTAAACTATLTRTLSLSAR